MDLNPYMPFVEKAQGHLGKVHGLGNGRDTGLQAA